MFFDNEDKEVEEIFIKLEEEVEEEVLRRRSSPRRGRLMRR